MRDGGVVVDLWGGHCDRKRTKPWRRDTLVTEWSTTRIMDAELDDEQRLNAIVAFRDSLQDPGKPNRDPRVAITNAGG